MATERNPHVRQLSRILLIDDDAITREVLAMLLEMHGIPIDTAEDGREALGLLDGAQNAPGELPLPVVILMDTQMPGLSGLALVEALRKRTPARIIAISGSEAGAEICAATDGFLLKPIEVESLVALLESGQIAAQSASSKLLQAKVIRPERTDASPAKIIDPVVLSRFQSMMSAAAVREVYQAVADDLEPRLAALETAMKAADQAEVMRIAHSIKGGCSMVGFTAAAEAAARLETHGTTGDDAISTSGTYPEELLRLHAALSALKGMLADEFSV